MLNQCVIVVPIYKEFNDLTDSELASLEQLRIVLSKRHDICFLTHDSIDIAQYKVIFNHETKPSVIYVDKKHFLNRENYAKFVSEKTFYEYFDSYQYMLIYQLDAFVFYDKLEYWCSLGYDYIGAPFFMEDFVKEGKMVGNGGFSLRKISAMINYINKNGDIDTPYRWVDDLFFSMNYGNILNIPTIDIARKFSIECHVQEEFNLSGELPFGCHAFEKYDRNFWLKYIPLYENSYNVLSLYLQHTDSSINTKSDWWLYDKLSLTAYYSDHKRDSLMYGLMAEHLNPSDKRLKNNVDIILGQMSKNDLIN